MGTVLLFVALLVVVELSYRRWVRRTSSRRRSALRPSLAVIDLAAIEGTGGDREAAPMNPEVAAEDAAMLATPPRDASAGGARRRG